MILKIIILVSAIPLGYLISWMARDELIAGRNWFLVLIVASFVGIIFGFYLKKMHISWSSGFIFILGAIGYYKSMDKKWTSIKK